MQPGCWLRSRRSTSREVERRVGLDRHLASEHHLLEPVGCDLVECDLDRVLPPAALLDGSHGEAGGTGERRGGGLEGRSDVGDPAPPVGAAADDPGGDRHGGGGVTVEGQRPHGDRAGAGAARPRRRRSMAASASPTRVDADPGRDARGRDPAAVLDPHEAVGPERVEEVVDAVEGAGDRPQVLADGRRMRSRVGPHTRVPVRSCTDPPVKVRRVDPPKPASCIASTSTARGRQVRRGLREVRVGLAVAGEDPTEQGHRAAEPHCVAGTHHEVLGDGGVERGDAATGAEHPGALAEDDVEVDEVAQRESADDAVDRGVGERERRGIAPHERRVGAGAAQHPLGEVEADRAVAVRVEVAAEVGGPAREVEHERAETAARATRPCAGATDGPGRAR